MTYTAIKVRGISKKYKLGMVGKPRYKTLRDQIATTLSKPVRKLLPGEKEDLTVVRRSFETTKKEQTIWALDDVSFDVQSGEVIGIIGRNGSGKSTLLKIITRITEPTRGTIDLIGRVGSLLEVGTGFHKELTGRENVYLNGAILGMKKQEIDRRFDEIVDFSEVEKFIDTPVKYYSSGMQVRLAFSVAAHMNPEILLVDEVLAVGDASFQQKSISKMEDVSKQGRTVLFVSHHMPSVLRLCERVILLNQGHLVADGPGQEIVSQYLNNSLGTNAVREWTSLEQAPGNDIVRLRAIRVRNQENKSVDSIDIREPVGLEMEYEVLQPGYALYPHFVIHNEEGLHLFTTIDTDPEWRGKPRPVGCYVSTGWIPGNLLSEGTIMVGPSMRTESPKIIHFYLRDAVAFHVIESPDGDTARVDYPGRFPGVVRPYLKWTTDYSPVRSYQHLTSTK